MLHVTNGDATGDRLRAAGVPGGIIPWRDVLHEGPVPSGLSTEELRPVRARFVADQGWAAYDTALGDFKQRDLDLAAFRDHEEVVLWFEHDLYDQLQLIQILDRFAVQDLGRTLLSLVCVNAFPGVEHFHGLGQLDPDQIASLLPSRRGVAPAQLALARRAWAAFRSADPRDAAALAAAATPDLPFLSAALHRHLEQFPSVRDGLSRTERQILDAVAAGAATPDAVFRADQEREVAPFMGDLTFWSHLHRLNDGLQPLVAIAAPAANSAPDDGRRQEVTLTERGRDVLAGRADRLRPDGIDRWLGGVHLHGAEAAWRWDGQRLVAWQA